jgi:hypothetical protein
LADRRRKRTLLDVERMRLLIHQVPVERQTARALVPGTALAARRSCW